MTNPIHIYNSLTRKNEVFVPIEPQKVKMYVCGPTVYDEPHIGHARSAYIFDVIRRYFAYKNYKVTFVRNVTDVDDKIIEKARKEYPGEDLNLAVKKVSDKYLASYHEAVEQLGILKPDFEPKATEYVSPKKPAMQAFIQKLIDCGAAYVSGGDVYFDIKKAKDYGKLSHQSIDKMESGARVSPGEKKNDPLDFALWKAAKEGEPSWDSQWGAGRPGWHIECSVMSSDILGDEFDIHGGGLDLIFPHHENEIAQSEGAGKKFARVWMHHGLLTINGQKMAKSLGNFVTIKDFLTRHKDADVLKLFFLSAHYSHPIDYSEEKIEESRQALERISILINKIHSNLSKFEHQVTTNQIDDIENIKNKFEKSMDDDFNTPQALAAIFDLVNIANKNIDDLDFIRHAEYTLKELSGTLGMNLTKIGVANLDEHILSMIFKREKARQEKNFVLSDKIRKELEGQNIILEDTKDGKTTWRRKP
ncbi:MAG: cysteine--tRNA ligase [Candidatus Omnitrophota bacterium]|nr:cysteine--tRNA ligase [Candidatus Omnitrophota bacterium]